MYTIGQIANILGITKDKLRYYEEKGILAPIQSDNNNYRQYDFKDIITILSIEFYRSLDIDFKTIKKIHEQSCIKDIECILDKKRDEAIKKINRLNTIVRRIDEAKKGCNDIDKYLNKYTIRSMGAIKVLGEISDFRAFNEFDIIHKNRGEIEDASIIKSLIRYLTFNEGGLVSSKMLITKDLDNENMEKESDVIKYEKCIYTIVEDGLKYKNVMEDTFIKTKQWIYKNGYKDMNIAILSMALMEPQGDRSKSYLEIYIPIE